MTRSEIHEKMSCTRCQNDASGTENMEEGNEINVDDIACQIDQEDIGGFAKDAGCFHLLKNSERQVPSCACLQYIKSKVFLELFLHQFHCRLQTLLI